VRKQPSREETLMAKYRKLFASLGMLAVVLMSAGAEWKW
jgi:hypothetical protein